ncbi:MAG TPA: hypothetical protein VGL92_15280, partial [Acidimicrobiia bacterium]
QGLVEISQVGNFGELVVRSRAPDEGDLGAGEPFEDDYEAPGARGVPEEPGVRGVPEELDG